MSLFIFLFFFFFFSTLKLHPERFDDESQRERFNGIRLFLQLKEVSTSGLSTVVEHLTSSAVRVKVCDYPNDFFFFFFFLIAFSRSCISYGIFQLHGKTRYSLKVRKMFGKRGEREDVIARIKISDEFVVLERESGVQTRAGRIVIDACSNPSSMDNESHVEGINGGKRNWASLCALTSHLTTDSRIKSPFLWLRAR